MIGSARTILFVRSQQRLPSCIFGPVLSRYTDPRFPRRATSVRVIVLRVDIEEGDFAYALAKLFGIHIDH